MSDVQLTEYGPMAASYLSANLSELCVEKIGVQTGPFGSQLHKEDYVEIGTPIITVEHLDDNRIVCQDTPRVSDEDKERLSKYNLQEGDIVFSRVGSVDRRALVRAEENGWLFSGRCLRVRVDKSKIDPVYLSYFFGLESFKNYIRSIAVGATMPSINTKILSDLPIYYPEDLNEQRRIAEIFYANDEKIELNRQTNQTLEHIAQAIFKSWFVDFEPVKAKIAAKQAFNSLTPEEKAGLSQQDYIEQAAQCAIAGKTKEQLQQLDPDTRQQLKTTAALFPDALVDSELGEIPEGWEVKPLDEVAHYQNGLALQKFRPSKHEDSLPVLKIAQLKKGFADGKEKATAKIKSECIVDDGDVVFSWSGSLIVDVWCGGRAALNQHLFKVTSKDYPKWFYFNWTTHHLKSFQQIAADKAVTMGHIKREHLSTAKCVIPNFDLAEIDIVANLLEKKIEQRIESFSLQKLRDSLLPRLLSGEVKVAGDE